MSDAPSEGLAPAQSSDGSPSAFATVIAHRMTSRAANTNPPLRNQPRDLKSDLKKGTIIAKKIRTYACENEATMLNELNTYNLKMFVKETAQGVGAVLFESPKPLRTADVTSLTVLCSALHQRYDEFLAEVLTHIKKGFDMEPLLAEMTRKFDPAAPHADVHKIRSTVRFLCEWWLTGLLTDAKFIIGVLQRIVMSVEAKGAAADAQGHLTVNALTIVNMIVRTVGIELMGGSASATQLQVAGHGANTLAWSEADGKVVPVDAAAQAAAVDQCKQRHDQPLVKASSFSSEAERAEFSKRVNMICDHAVGLCTKLKKGVEGKWRQICEQAELRGDPTQEVKDAFQCLQKEVLRLYVLTENLLTAVGRGQELPAPLDLTAALQKSTVDTQLTFTSGSAEFFTVRLAETMNYYDDDEQRAFYEDVTPIDTLIPPMEGNGNGIPMTHQQLQKKSGAGPAASSDTLAMMDDSEASLQGIDGSTKGATALPPDQRKLLDYRNVDALLVALHRCSSLATAQKWLEDYLEEATKYFFPERLPPDVDPVRPAQARAFFLNCKMMLLVELRYEPDRAQELIPFLARVAAGMHSRFPEFGEALAKQLENHIFDAIRNKRPNTFHSKLLNTRYLCELVKFRVCPPIRVIRITHLCVDTFEDEHSVLMSAIIVKYAASFLLRGGVTRVKMEEALGKLKQAAKDKGIASRAETDYEHAWVDLRQAMNPARIRKVLTRVKTPLELYLAQVIYVRLQDSAESFAEARERVLKLPWNDACPANMPIEEVRATRETLVRVFRKAHHISYDRVHLLVRLIADVTRVHGTSCLVQPIVDHMLEDFRRDLESNGGHRTMQKRIQDMKFMAELYNYKLVPLRVITYSVALLLLYKPCGPTHPQDYTRLRCALQLIRYSAPYFLNKGRSVEKQVTRRLLSLIFCHVHADVMKPLPMDLDYCLETTLINISKLYDDSMRRGGGGGDRRRAATRNSNDGDSVAAQSYYFIANFPRTNAKAMEFAEQVRCESLFDENAYLEEVIQGVTSADAQQHKRCFPVLSIAQQRSSAPSSAGTTAAAAGAVQSQIGAVVEPTRRTRGPRVRATPAGGDAPATSSTNAEDEHHTSSSSESDSEGSSSSDDDSSEDEDAHDSSSSSSGSSSSESGDSDDSSDSSDSDEEDEDEESDEEDVSDEEDDDSSSDSDETSSDDEDEEPKLGPLANARLLNQRNLPARGTTNDEDLEFDAMFRDAVKESSQEGARRSANKTTQQQEKIVESRMASVNVASMAKQLHQDPVAGAEPDASTKASLRLLAAHQKLRDEELAQRKARKAAATSEASAAAALQPQPTEVNAVRVTVLRRATAAAPGASGSTAVAARPVEGRQLLIPMDSEFAKRSQAFVEQSHRDRALVQQQTIMMLRQHEEEEARASWPMRLRGRGGRGGRGGQS